MSATPISPIIASKRKVDSIPSFVIDSVNELIIEKGRKSKKYFEATVYQKDIVARIMSKENVLANYIYDNNWLDFEDIFRKAGWKVTYDKPAYYEQYDAFFKFEGNL